MKVPKALQKAIGKIDPRMVPPEEEAKKFKSGSGRRYINVGIKTVEFYAGVAEQVDDDELREYAQQIATGVYTKNEALFKGYVGMFQNRMAELGIWRSIKGLSRYQKAKLLRKAKKIADEHKGDKK